MLNCLIQVLVNLFRFCVHCSQLRQTRREWMNKQQHQTKANLRTAVGLHFTFEVVGGFENPS